MEHVANDDDVEDNITITHMIKSGSNNILQRQTKLINVVKLKYVGKTVKNTLHGRQ